jgi:hypothetical protein
MRVDDDRERVRVVINIFTRELPEADGAWWIAERAVRIRCCRCNRTTRDRPAVMRRRSGRDTGGDSGRKHPGWPDAGWLVWWECDLCGYTDTSGRATDAQVRAIAIIAGPWTRRDSAMYLAIVSDSVTDDEAL